MQEGDSLGGVLGWQRLVTKRTQPLDRALVEFVFLRACLTTSGIVFGEYRAEFFHLFRVGACKVPFFLRIVGGVVEHMVGCFVDESRWQLIALSRYQHRLIADQFSICGAHTSQDPPDLSLTTIDHGWFRAEREQVVCFDVYMLITWYFCLDQGTATPRSEIDVGEIEYGGKDVEVSDQSRHSLAALLAAGQAHDQRDVQVRVEKVQSMAEDAFLLKTLAVITVENECAIVEPRISA